MKKFKLILPIILLLTIAVTLFACSGESTLDSNGEEVVIDYKNISEVSVLNADKVEDPGFLFEEFELSMITIHITYVDESSVDIPLKENMIKAESKSALTVPGTHKISCNYGGRFDFDFVIKLYKTTVKSYEVTFYDEDGDRVVGTQIVPEGTIVTPPAMQTKTGYTHVGWKNKETGETVVDFSVGANVSYIAVYEPDYYEVRFYYTIGEKSTLISVASVPRGESAVPYAPEIPTVVGYSNGRWSNESAMTSVTAYNRDFYVIYDSDKVLITFSYYKYIEGEYYDSNISWSVALATEGVTPPDDVERLSDNVFLYWYVERDGKEIKVDFPYEVSGEVKFIAKYASYDAGTSSLVYSSDGNVWTVEGLEAGATDETIVIPKTRLGLPVAKIANGAFANTSVKRFVISTDNPIFRADNGVLYDGSLSELIVYPVNADRVEYEIARSTQEIAPYAFMGAKNLEKVIFPNTVLSIGEGAFSECRVLNEIALPEGVTTIEKYLIRNSSEIKTISIGSSVTEIKDGAFYGAASIREIVLPATLESLGSEVFAECNALERITIDRTHGTANPLFTVNNGILYGYNETRTNLYYYLYAYPAKFSAGSNASEIIVNGDTKVIKSGAFINAAIIGLNITSSSIKIEEKSIVCPTIVSVRTSGLINLENNAFGDYAPEIIYLSGDGTVHFGNNDPIPTEHKEVSYRDFYNGFAYQLNGNKATIIAYKNSVEYLEIPSMLGPYEVEKINSRVFTKDTTLKEVVIADTIEEIGDYAFYGCTHLTKVTLGKGLSTLGEYAFANCSKDISFCAPDTRINSFGVNAFGDLRDDYPADDNGLVIIGGVLLDYKSTNRKVVIGNNVSVIDRYAFKNTPYVAEIDFTNAIALVKILDFAFIDCEELLAVELPINLESVSVNAFSGCARLTTVSGVPENNPSGQEFTDIGTKEDSCYEIEDGKLTKYNGSLSVVVLPDSITSIGNNVFEGRLDLTYVVLNDEIVSIGDSAFENCYNLSGIKFSNSLNSIGNRAFFGCTSLHTLSFSNIEELESVAYDAFDETPWLKYYIDDSIIINDYYYKYNGKMSILHIPNGIRFVNDRAFYQNTTLETIYIPESVEIIGEKAFYYSNIRKINFAISKVMLREIRKEAFYGCKQLEFWDSTSLSRLEIIGDSAFANIAAYQNAMLNIFIPASVRSIGESAFKSSSINTVRVGSGSKLEYLSADIFAGCGNLESVLFEGISSLYEIRHRAFYNCVNLRVFNGFNCKIETIAAEAFYGCEKLEGFNIDSAYLIEVGQNAFYDNKFVTDNDDTMIFVGTVLVKYNGYLNSVIEIPTSTTAIADSAFAGSKYIQEIRFTGGTNPASIKEIQANAFANCISLKKIVLPNSLEVIGDKAFSGCTSLASVKFGNKVKEIGYMAFAGTAITDITLPKSLSVYGGNVFAYCDELAVINVESNNEKFYAYDGILYSFITEKEGGIYKRYAQLEEYPGKKPSVDGRYNIPDTIYIRDVVYTVKSIGNYAFASRNTALNKISINSSIESIGQYAFANMGIEIIFADNTEIKTISDYAFAEYLGTGIKIPQSVTTIGNYAFYNAVNLEGIRIPAAITEIGSYAFGGISTYILWSNDSKLTMLHDYAFSEYCGSDLTIPAGVKHLGKGVFYGITAAVSILSEFTKIDDYAFYGYKGVTTPVIPETVVEIGDYAFAEMTNVTEVLNLPKSVVVIGKNAFYDVSADINFDSESEIERIGEYAFEGYKGNKIYIPSGVKAIANYAFKNSGISDIYFDEHSMLESIGEYSFAGAALQQITIPNSVMEIGQRAFMSCLNIKNVSFEEDSALCTMGSMTFEGCDNLTSLELPFIGANNNYDINSYLGYLFGANNYTENYIKVPKSLAEVVIIGSFSGNGQTIIGPKAFNGCIHVKKVTISDNVYRIEDGAFIGCNGLIEMTLPYSGIFGNLFGADKYSNNIKYVPSDLETVTLTSITSLDEYAFYGCNKIKTINFPHTLTKIGDYAFYSCSQLSRVFISDAVTEIGYAAFSKCTSMKEFVVDRNNPCYLDDGGVLYSYNQADLTAVLLAYPQNKTDNSYEIDLHIGDTAYETVEIGSFAFWYSKVTEMILPDTVSKIGENAFAYSNIETIKIGTSDIGKNAFLGNSIKNVYVDDAALISAQADDNRLFSKATAIMINTSLEFTSENIEKSYVYNHYTRLLTDETKLIITVSKFTNTYSVCYRLNDPKYFDVKISEAKPNIKDGIVYFDGEENLGGRRYIVGSIITLRAEPKDGFIFVGWFNNDKELISMDQEIQYEIVNKNIVVVAQFESILPENTKILACETDDKENIYYVIDNDDDLELVIEGSGEVNVPDALLGYKELIKNIRIGEGLTDIPDGEFSGYIALTAVSLPSTVEHLGNRAFYGCNKLLNVYIPASINTIGTETFADCTELAGVTLNNGLLRIESKAFKGTKITTLSLPASVTYVERDAIQGCAVLNSIQVQRGNRYYYADASGVLYAVEREGYTAMLYLAPTLIDGTYTLREKVTIFCEDYEVIAIGEGAFSGCSYLTKLVISDTVRRIETAAFDGCNALTSITIGKALVEIAEEALSDSSITEIIIVGEAHAVIDGILYLYGENAENAKEARVIYNFTGAVIPGSVVINGNDYTVKP